MKLLERNTVLCMTCFALADLAVQPGGFGQDYYEVVNLGALPGHSVSSGYALNESDEVAGTSRTASGDEYRAFVWETGTMTNLGTVSGRPKSYGRAINELGQVVGETRDASGGSPPSHAFLWLPEPAYGRPAGMNELGTLGGSFSTAFDMNDQGHVVGWADSINGIRRGFVWLPSPACGLPAGMNELPTFGGRSPAVAINNSCQVVGFSSTSGMAPDQHAYIWQDGVMTDLGTLGGNQSEAWDINELGEVVGCAKNSGDEMHAVLWQDDMMIDLGTLGGPWSVAHAINNAGKIVGSARTVNSDQHAFIWDNGAMTDLNDLIPADSGWTLTHAMDISDATHIVGLGTNADGETHGFLLTPQGPVEVDVDIKPGSYPNSINLGSHGLIPVAILSSDTFDATQVDAGTVNLAGAGVAVRGRGNNVLAHEEDVNADGLVDLVVQLETENLDPGQFQDGYGVLIGSTLGGQEFVGSDEITIVP